MSLLVDYCNHKAAKYACENWHYSECIPPIKNVTFGVWEKEVFIGAVVYSRGVNGSIGSFVGLGQEEAVELTRVALTDHNAPVSQIVSYTMDMLKKKDNGLRMLVSYADPAQGHHGGIYQAMNWYYIGQTEPSTQLYDEDGNAVHQRTKNMATTNNYSTKDKYESLERRKVPGKHKYVYPLDSEIQAKVKDLSKPYP
jgi:hypothetical protein